MSTPDGTEGPRADPDRTAAREAGADAGTGAGADADTGTGAGADADADARTGADTGTGTGADTSGTGTGRETSVGGSGSVRVGLLTGGAVAAGARARAEDRSTGRSERTALPPGVLPAVPPAAVAGDVGIGAMTAGAAAAGPDAIAVDASTGPVGTVQDLRAAVGVLREQLRLLGSGAEAAEIDHHLAEAQAEIESSGRVRPERLQWLRDHLELGATATAALASAATVAQQIAQILGGPG
ncbi:hypothetical protein [Streptomyces sp. CB00455]|uniref:hypothetical protein n=1 Tax=Streptomyces sp. CB00455 TaxID=1703927 RepID=UPI0009A12ABC|nr:hypothetical protein [Streptomyces sp. CB00455]